MNAVDRTDAAMEVKDPVPGGVNGMIAGSDLYIVHTQQSLTSLAVSEKGQVRSPSLPPAHSARSHTSIRWHRNTRACTHNPTASVPGRRRCQEGTDGAAGK